MRQKIPAKEQPRGGYLMPASKPKRRKITKNTGFLQVGRILHLEHFNHRVPDQDTATAFFMNGLGLTRDP